MESNALGGPRGIEVAISLDDLVVIAICIATKQLVASFGQQSLQIDAASGPRATGRRRVLVVGVAAITFGCARFALGFDFALA